MFLWFVVGIMLLLWAVHVFVLWAGLGFEGAGRVLFLVGFNALFALTLLSLCLASTGDPGRVPFKWVSFPYRAITSTTNRSAAASSA
jgi:hypothetical protein